MASRLAELYERDFYAWTKTQAEALQRLAATRPNVPIDWPNLVEEVEELGKQRRDALRSQLRHIMQHLLYLQASTRSEPRAGWMDEIDTARDAIADRLTETLRQDLEAQLPSLYTRARRAAAAKLARYDEAEAASTLPDTCPWTLAQLLDMEWWPEQGRVETMGQP